MLIDQYHYDHAANTKIRMKSFRWCIFYKQLSIRTNLWWNSAEYSQYLMIYQYLLSFEWLNVKSHHKIIHENSNLIILTTSCVCRLNAIIFIFNDSIRTQTIKFYDCREKTLLFGLALLIFTQCLIENVHKCVSMELVDCGAQYWIQLIWVFLVTEYKYFTLLQIDLL